MEVDPTNPQVDSAKAARLEIAHVLFTDVVGYSRLPMEGQTESLRRLQEVVRGTEEFREAQARGRLISLPTGDGMALVFFGSPEDPARCAMSISRALRGDAGLGLRMGVHSGPVYRVADINAQMNVAGGGINVAQRVMDCGDAGHILVSNAAAEVLAQLSGWEDKLHDLGEAGVKHGARVHLFNLHAEGVGNADLPNRVRAEREATSNARPPTGVRRVVARLKRHKAVAAAMLVTLIAATGTATYFAYAHYSVGAGRVRSLAVLPFVNASKDPETDYLSDGISESLINRLSQLPDMKVIARSSSFRYKGGEIDVREAAKALGVETILTGVVTQHGDSLTVSTELINADDGTQMWNRQYSHKLADALVLQTEIAREISGSLRPKLSGAEEGRITRRYTDDPEAYQSYLKGLYFLNKRSAENLTLGAEQFRQAIARDPDNPLAYVGLADCYGLLSEYNGMMPAEGFPKAKELAARALDLDETLAEAHNSLAFVKMDFDLDNRGAEVEFKRAIDLNPNYSQAHHWYALNLFSVGRFDEAFAELKRAYELDPLSLALNRNWGRMLWMVHRDDQSIAQLRRTVELEPTFAGAHRDLAYIYYFKRMNAEGLAEYLQSLKYSGSSGEEVAAFQEAYRASGWRGIWQKQVELEQERVRQGKIVYARTFAMNYALLGDKEQTLAWLERAYQNREGEGLRWIKSDPRLDGTRPDPRFQDLVRKVGLTQ